MELQTMPLRFRVWDKNEKCFVPIDYDWGFAIRIDGGISHHHGVIDYGWQERFVISQDTGCKDDTGEPLYTGDIVEDTMFDFGEHKIKMVIQYNGYANVAKRPDGLEDSLFGSSRLHKVGNIWQNPELLEEE